MYRQFGNSDYRSGLAGRASSYVKVAQSGQLDALVALERIGTRLSFGAMTRSMPKAMRRNAGTR
jgi:hypothetical protein